ncbi:MAG: thioredoxin domain-containing protein, partial [Acidiferrobacteraceae bacterium]
DQGGLNITEAARRALYPATDATFARAMEDSDGFVLGTQGPLVTLVVDPNCTFCHRTWLALQPLLQAGRLRVRLVPVAIVDPDTAMVRGAEILSSRAPAVLWSRNEQQFHSGTEQGGLSLDLPITNAGRVALARNTETFLQAFPGGHPATPTFILGQQVHTGAMTAPALQAWLSAAGETP